MKFTVLGSGTSHGVPMIACDCRVCCSTNPRDRHYRQCLLVTTDSQANIVVDTPPEFRLQAIERGLRMVDAVFFTHAHADHLFGLDDMRIFNYARRGPIPLLAEQEVLDTIECAFRYCFVETQMGGGKPQLELVKLEPGQPVGVGGIQVLPLRVMHGNLPVLGYKFGEKAAYVTDVSYIPDEAWAALQDLDLLFLDATRREPHSTHFHLERSLDVISRLRPKQAYLVHLAHDYLYDEDNPLLPDGVELAYDGLEVEI